MELYLKRDKFFFNIPYLVQFLLFWTNLWLVLYIFLDVHPSFWTNLWSFVIFFTSILHFFFLNWSVMYSFVLLTPNLLLLYRWKRHLLHLGLRLKILSDNLLNCLFRYLCPSMRGMPFIDTGNLKVFLTLASVLLSKRERVSEFEFCNIYTQY